MDARKGMKRILTVAGVFAIVVTAGAQGFGGGPGTGPGQTNRPPMERSFGSLGAGAKGWWNNPRMVEKLKLTDDQRKGMDAILLQHREKLIDLRANLEKAELALQPLMGADTPNDAAITAQIDKVVQARADLERANARFLLALREKLTADQWKQIQTSQQERSSGWHRDGGSGRPGEGFRRQPPTQQQAPPPPANAPGPGSAE